MVPFLLLPVVLENRPLNGCSSGMFCYGWMFALIVITSLSINTTECNWYLNRTFAYPVCHLSVCQSVSLSGKCTVAKRLIGSWCCS